MKSKLKYQTIIRFLLIVVFIPIINAQGIYHDPKISWDTIKSEHFNVHVPTTYIKLGLKITDICERVYPIVSQSLDYKPHLTHVIVHTENDETNGMASLFPWRMELYVNTPQSNIIGKNISWLESLILHEFTHIVHLRKHKGISSLTKPFLGDFNAVWQMITPVWFTEGIATFNETRFGKGGRGRNPHFWMQMAEPIFSENYWKLDNTSYYSRKKLPSFNMPYISGYYIADRVTRDFGEYAWGRILNRYSSYPIFGFKKAVKSVTGLNVNFYYDDIIDEFKHHRNHKVIVSNLKLWHNSDILEGQYSPRWFDENNILFYQKGIEKTQQLIKVHRSGEVKKLLNRKLTNIDNSFAFKGGMVYTSEQHISPKFTATKYSDLYLYDLKYNNKKRLTNNKRLYSIDISPDNSEIIAVQTYLPGNRLVVLDSRSGVIQQFINFEKYIVLNPRWSPSGNKIAMILQDSTGITNIAVYDLKSNKWRYIYKPNLNQDNHPCWSHDEKYIYFSSDQSGVFNIWATEVMTGDRWMVTDVDLGAFTPDVSLNGNEIAFSTYTKFGFRIATQKLDISKWIQSNEITNKNELLYSRTETIYSEIEKDEKQPYTITKYSPLSQVIKPQGWIPYVYEEEEGMGIAAYLRAEDALHRHMWHGRFGLSLNRIAPAFDMNYMYSKFWPKITFRTYSLPKKVKTGNEIGWWRENGFEFGVATPLIWENNVYKTTSLLSMQINQKQLKKSKGAIEPNQKLYRGVRLEFQLNRSSYTFKNITPYFAWLFSSKFEVSNKSLFSDYTAKRFSLELDLLLPILQSSNIELYFGYLLRSGDYNYKNNFVPIGFATNNSDQQFRLLAAYYQPLVFLEWQTPIIPMFIEYIYLKPFIDNNFNWNGSINQSDTDYINSIGFQLSAKNIIFYRYKFEFGINIYKKSINSPINYSPFIQFNI